MFEFEFVRIFEKEGLVRDALLNEAFSCSFLNHATTQQRCLTTCPTKSALMAAFLSPPPSLPQPPLPPPPPPILESIRRACCRCSRSGICKRCVCVKTGRSCSTSCLPEKTVYVMSSSRGLPPCCCRCKSTWKCLRCACVRDGTPCSRCLPGDTENCHNTTPRLPHGPSTPLPPGSNTSPPYGHLVRGPSAVVPSDQRPDPSLPTTVCLDLPSLITIFQAPCPTLKHVSKGVRDSWARVVSECLHRV